ncbi:potassium-transporting ATPase subunit F [Microterricola viridarii]|nr:potassium-transporting ATPase subunit F [Microterricola viridarii]
MIGVELRGILDLLSAALAIAALGYLAYALLHPERF